MTTQQQIAAVDRERARVRARAAEIARARCLSAERVAASALKVLRHDDPRCCWECGEPLTGEKLGEAHAACEARYDDYRERRQQAMLADEPWPLVDLIRGTL